MNRHQRRRYWRTNLLYISVLLALWASVSLGAGVLFADRLDAHRLGGFKLGFWFGQQGSIATFVVIIFVYVGLMNRLDKKYSAGSTTDETDGTRSGMSSR